MLSVMLSAQTPPEGDPFSNLGGQVINKAKLTKGMWFIAVLAIIILTFLISYSKIPALNESLSLDKQDIKNGYYAVIVLAVLFGFLYALPEVISRFKHGKNID